ncbi:Glucosamine-6-phosphate isomerase (Glucosamine-6-phosphate deaminase) (GNPDA) (GlcN6P deaminase) [Microbotryomycetes sp. JL201]|nr:Glucosamine-6-phosphate isomerase (Glucosamine-6-phosphate deaminase) (GNPDA) (GlcN6P deaminase) [Microbotryomycetes sp. JL201]
MLASSRCALQRLGFVVGLAALHLPAAALWPHPLLITNGTGFLRISESFKIEFTQPNVFSTAQFGDLNLAIEETVYHLEHDHHQRLIVGRDQQSSLLQSYTYLTDCLVVPSDSTRATLEANTTLGLLRGLQTFSQLVYELPQRAQQSIRYIVDVPLEIRDRPVFPHRAFMLDTARNFYPVSDILRTLDAMSFAKLNVFHWHATDSQAWPLYVPAFPHLNKNAAYSPVETYSRWDILHIQEYANARGISVLLEVDMPGHTASVASFHPDHVVCLGENTNWARYAAEPPTGQLRLNKITTTFAANIIGSASSMIKSPYFSTGGDEVNENCYLEDKKTQQEMEKRGNATLDLLLTDFVGSVHDRLRHERKTPVVWEEMVLNHELSLGLDTIVTVWISSANVRAVANKGFRIIHAASDYFYLDCGAGGWLGNVQGGGDSWCDPFKSWQKIYSFDPYANVTARQRRLILGGEALLWSEQADPTNLDSMAWPRAAAAAEVFWTGEFINGEARSGKEALPRLHDWRYRMLSRGIRGAPLQPHACALTPGLCDKSSIS